MPRALQLVTNLVPARYFLVALRGIVLKGAEVATLTGPLVALAASLVPAMRAVRIDPVTSVS